MFKRVLSRKKRANNRAEESANFPRTVVVGIVERDENVVPQEQYACDVSASDEPPGFKRNASPTLLNAKNPSPDMLKAAVNVEILKRSLSAKSQARLDMARWRSNGSCAFNESELVLDPLCISRSRLTVRTQPMADDMTATSTVADVLGPKQEAPITKAAKPSRASLERTRQASGTVSILRTPTRTSTWLPPLDREPSDLNPFDEGADYRELLRHQQCTTHPRTSPKRKPQIRRPSSAWERKVSRDSAVPHTPLSYESILDGHQRNGEQEEEDEILFKKVLSPTHQELPERKRTKSKSQGRQLQGESPKYSVAGVPVKRSVSFVNAASDEKQQRKCIFGGHGEQPQCKLIMEEPIDHNTFCGWMVP